MPRYTRPLDTVGTAVTSRWRNPLRKRSALKEVALFRIRIDRVLWVKQRTPIRPSRTGKRYAAFPIRKNRLEANNAPTDSMRFLGGVIDPDEIFFLPGTKETRLRSVNRLNAINTTPITSRLR